jgi:prepilin-type N-terminal cleavage/methylation domain-containing protein
MYSMTWEQSKEPIKLIDISVALLMLVMLAFGTAEGFMRTPEPLAIAGTMGTGPTAPGYPLPRPSETLKLLGAAILRKPHREKGFTLIEMSIVLVIIGALIGGVLVGQTLISAAQVRAQLTQIEKYNQAVNTFYGKYGFLPGDINGSAASQFGFAARGPYGGQGDGNGVIEGNACNCNGGNWGDQIGSGELAMFWVDLTSANGLNLNIIEGSFQNATPTGDPSNIIGTSLSLYFPTAKVGYGNHVYVYSGGPIRVTQPDSANYFGLSAITAMGVYGGGSAINSSATIPTKSACAIDKKMDDGLPQSGNVTANYFNEPNSNQPTWAGTTNNGATYTTATKGTSTTCFDNGNSAGAAQQYSMTTNGGAGANCALSFRFQ